MLITRKAEFSASHSCYNSRLSEEDNKRLYGESSGSFGHGHNYVLEVTLSGEPDPISGMIVDLKIVKDVIESEVVGPMDHRHLNHEVRPFDTVVPTTENLAREIWQRLEQKLSFPRAHLQSLRLYETSDLYVDYDGVSQ